MSNYNKVLALVKQGFTIRQSLRHYNLNKTLFYKSISLSQKKEITVFKNLRAKRPRPDAGLPMQVEVFINLDEMFKTIL